LGRFSIEYLLHSRRYFYYIFLGKSWFWW